MTRNRSAIHTRGRSAVGRGRAVGAGGRAAARVAAGRRGVATTRGRVALRRIAAAAIAWLSVHLLLLLLLNDLVVYKPRY
jgi:hypothetical protein